MTNTILRITDLKKAYRSQWSFRAKPALTNVSFGIEQGELVGFLGHNGAGKTTAIKCILGLLRPSSGIVEFCGEPLLRPCQRQAIGYLPEQPYFYDHLSVLETMEFFAGLVGLKGKDCKNSTLAILEKVGLAERARQRVRGLSKGLQQRLGLAQAIINSPRLLLLDEPFSGLDPIGRVEVRNLILELNRAGTTIMLSSHILADVEQMCSRVIMLARGEVKRDIDLIDSDGTLQKSYQLVLPAQRKLDLVLEQMNATADGKEVEHRQGGVVHIFEFAGYDKLLAAFQLCQRESVNVERFGPRDIMLEKLFLEAMGDAR